MQGTPLQIRDINAYPRTKLELLLISSDLINSNNAYLDACGRYDANSTVWIDHNAGFTQIGDTYHKNFQQMLEDFVDPSENAYTDLIAIYGERDYLADPDDLADYISAFIAKAREMMPGIRIHIGMLPWTKETGATYDAVINEYSVGLENTLTNPGVNWIPFAGLTHRNQWLPASGVGLSSAPQPSFFYNEFLLYYLTYGKIMEDRWTETVTITNAAGVTGSADFRTAVDLSTNRVRLYTESYVEFTISTGSLTMDGTNPITIGSLDTGWVFGRNAIGSAEELSTWVDVLVTTSSEIIPCRAGLWIIGGTLQICPVAYTAGSATPRTVTPTKIRIQQFHAEGDLITN